LSFNPEKVSLPLGYYLAGFADGEGSFNVSFRKSDDYKNFWKVSACFNISQKDSVILSMKLRNMMNDGGKRKYTEEEILKEI